jgi:hypothetical protein
MKWIIILALVALLIVIVSVRFRRQIQTAIYLFRMVRKMRAMSRAEMPEADPRTAVAESADELVRCSKCGKWSSKAGAKRFGTTSFYCSDECMTTAVR